MMILRLPRLPGSLLAAFSLLVFLVGGHFAANALIASQQTRQIDEIAQIALRRAEAAIDFGVRALGDLAREKNLGCDPASLQTVRLHVYRRGMIKDFRIVNANGGVLCSAYSETLEFDRGWPSRDEMLETRDDSLRLFRVDQFFGTALGVMKDTGPQRGLVAILGANSALFDIMPAEIRHSGYVELELSNGETLARSSAREEDLWNRPATFSATSRKYPIRAKANVDLSALGSWNREPYAPIMLLSGLLGLAFGLLATRAARRIDSPVAELDRAIAAREFHPYLQPLFDLRSGAIVGAEVLARWVREDGTVVPPSRFIELAEDSGRIETITWQLLSAALDEVKPAMARDPRFKISLNVSPRHFISSGFVGQLRRTVEGTGVNTGQITLELTEREAFSNLDQAAETVARVRGLGFKVAIDDVGIGHSGLSQIQRLGADTLKIDKFFVDCINLDQSAVIVVEMLVRLASEMKLGIVAEGIETDEQASALMACGVECGQGYLVAPPLPAGDFLRLLAERGRRNPPVRAA